MDACDSFQGCQIDQDILSLSVDVFFVCSHRQKTKELLELLLLFLLNIWFIYT